MNALVAGIRVFLADGHGSFGDPIVHFTEDIPSSLAVADLNNDTWLDIVACVTYKNNLYIFFGSANGSFTLQQMDSGVFRLDSAVLHDFNNDLRLDIAVINKAHCTVCIHIGIGNGSFVRQERCLPTQRYCSIGIEDFNNDRQLDIIIINNDGNKIQIFFGNGNGSFALRIIYGNNMPFTLDGIADMNNDSYLDLMSIDDNHIIRMYFGNADGTFTEGPNYSVGFEPTSLLVADFNKDNRQDLVVVNSRSDNIGVLMGYVSQGIAYQTTLTTKNASRPQSIIINDFNNDTRMDVAIAYSASDNIAIFFGFNNYSFAPAIIYAIDTDSSPSSIATGDFNKDNCPDIVVANFGKDNIGIFFGTSNGSFSSQKTITTTPHLQPSSVAVGDFDNDGLHDIIVAFYTTNEIGVFISYGDNTFKDMFVISADFGSQPFLVVVSDFDNNRKLDFAVANEGTDNLHIYLQTC